MPQKVKKIRIFLGRVILVFSLMGPEIAQASPQFSCLGATLGQTQENGMVAVHLKMQGKNPEAHPIHLEYGVLDLRVDHAPFGKAHLSSLVFPAHHVMDFPVTVLVPAERLFSLSWKFLTGQPLHWHATGTVQMDHLPLLVNQQGNTG